MSPSDLGSAEASASPGPSTRRRWVAPAALTSLCLIWGSTWLVIKGGLTDLAPLSSAAARFVVAASAMHVLAGTLGRRESGRSPSTGLWVVLGSTNFALNYAVVYLASAHLPSGLTSLLWGAYPMMMAAIGHRWVPGERVGGLQWLGFGAGLAGLTFLFATDVRACGSAALPFAGLLLCGPFATAVGTAYLKRQGPGVRSLELNRSAMTLCAVVLTALALWVERHSEHLTLYDVAHWPARAVASIAYLALLGTVTTFGLYFWLLRTIDANQMGLTAYATPLVALSLGYVVRREPVHATTVAGTLLILGGVFLVVRFKRPATRQGLPRASD